MWPDHSFSQINRVTERTIGVGVRDEREVVGSGWTKFEKSGSEQYKREVFINQAGQHPCAKYVKKV